MTFTVPVCTTGNTPSVVQFQPGPGHADAGPAKFHTPGSPVTSFGSTPVAMNCSSGLVAGRLAPGVGGAAAPAVARPTNTRALQAASNPFFRIFLPFSGRDPKRLLPEPHRPETPPGLASGQRALEGG